MISDQTSPNVQLIKELKEHVDSYLFISTEKMEKKGIRRWVEEASNVHGETIEVEEFSSSDIDTKLRSFDFNAFDKVYVNLTGGTKVMTLVAASFFESIGAEIFYITGRYNEFVKVFPVSDDPIATFKNNISLKEYLTAYGFEFRESEASGVPIEVTQQLYQSFIGLDIFDFVEEMEFLSSRRRKKKGVPADSMHSIARLLNALHYKEGENSLTDKDVRYLTGDWFEEYIGFSIKKELGLPDEDILIGAELIKEPSGTPRNVNMQLVGTQIDKNLDANKNEMDVMFMYDNRFYTIECKTSIIVVKQNKQGQTNHQFGQILGETLYKSDSLKNRFGLFANTNIITLTDLASYCAKDKSNLKTISACIDRANLSNIKIIDLPMLLGSSSLFNLIK